MAGDAVTHEIALNSMVDDLHPWIGGEQPVAVTAGERGQVGRGHLHIQSSNGKLGCGTCRA